MFRDPKIHDDRPCFKADHRIVDGAMGRPLFAKNVKKK